MKLDALFLQLEEVLRRQHELAGQLLQAAGRQNDALRRNDIELLKQAIAELSDLNGQMRQMEDSRESLRGRLENALAISSGTSLSDIAASAPGELSSRLLSLRRAMRLRLEELRQLNDTNNLLTRNALRLNATIMNIFRHSGGVTYGNSGRVQDAGRSVTALNKSV